MGKKSLSYILHNPPHKESVCGYCGGRGYINPRGMITSDDCPVCNGSEKSSVIDYRKWCVQVRAIFEVVK